MVRVKKVSEWFGLEALPKVLQLEIFRIIEEYRVRTAQSPRFAPFPYYQKVPVKGHRMEDSNWLFSIYF